MNLAESVLYSKKNLGAKITIESKSKNSELLFGECQSVIIITIEEKNLFKLISLASKLNIHTQTIGVVTKNSRLVINELVDLKLATMKSRYFNYYSNLLKGSSE